MSIQLINGDCLEVMKDLSANSIDCFICDLPYGQLHPNRKQDNNWYDRRQNGGNTCAWDIKIDLVEFWKQIERLMKNDHTPVLMFCNTKFGYDLIQSKRDWFRYDLVWDKGRGVSFLSANKMPMKSHEMIYVFSKKGAYYNRIDDMTDKKPYKCKGKQINSNTYRVGKGNDIERTNGQRCATSILTYSTVTNGKENRHPTEKPIELYKWLIERYSPVKGRLLDPTAGSCNSCFAGYELDRECIGIEKDKGFYDKAVKKLEGID